MKQFRRIVFWLHLASGVSIGLIVLVMAATGVLMSFERQIVDAADLRGLAETGDSPRNDRVSPEELLRAIPDTLARVTSLTWRSGRYEGVVEAAGSDRSWFLDAGNGAVVGTSNVAVRSFFAGVQSAHRWLAAPGDARVIGRSFTGIGNALLLFMVMSGLLLWWPRNWKKAAVLNVIMFRRGRARKARNFNRHNVLGIWSAIPLIVIAGTGVMISYPSIGDAVFAVYDRMAMDKESDVPAMQPPGDSLPDVTPGDLLQIVKETDPDWRRITMSVPAATDDRVVFLIDSGSGGQPHRQAELVLDRRSGAVLAFTPFERESSGTRFFETIRYLHTGEVFGPVGQFMAGIVSLAVVFLVWTGLTLAWLRGMRSLRERRGP